VAQTNPRYEEIEPISAPHKNFARLGLVISFLCIALLIAGRIINMTNTAPLSCFFSVSNYLDYYSQECFPSVFGKFVDPVSEIKFLGGSK